MVACSHVVGLKELNCDHLRSNPTVSSNHYLLKASISIKVMLMNTTEAVEAIRSFNRFYTNVIGVIDRHILGSPFSLTEVRILSEIYHNPECTARKIKATLNVDEGYLSRTISKLLGQGLIKRNRRKEDARAFRLSLTRKGTGTFRDLNERASVAIESMIGSLSGSEVAEIVHSMRRIKEIVSKSEATE